MWTCQKCGESFAGTPLTDTFQPMCEPCQHRKTLIKTLAREHFFFLSDGTEETLSDSAIRGLIRGGAIPPCNLHALAEAYTLLQNQSNKSDMDLFELLYCILLEALGAGDIKPGPQRQAILQHFGITEAQEEPETAPASFPTYQEFVAGLDSLPAAGMKFGRVDHTPPLAYSAGYEHGFTDGRREVLRGVPAKPAPPPQPEITDLPPGPMPKCGARHTRPEGEMVCSLDVIPPHEWHKDACGLEFQVRD